MGQIIKAVVDGEEREFELLRHGHMEWTHAINALGEIVPSVSIGPINAYALLRLVHKQHVFGPITYEETGEATSDIPAETYYLSRLTKAVVCNSIPQHFSYVVKIVKPLI